MGLTALWDERPPLLTTEPVHLHGSVASMQPAVLCSPAPVLTHNSSPSKAVFLNVLCSEASPVVPHVVHAERPVGRMQAGSWPAQPDPGLTNSLLSGIGQVTFTFCFQFIPRMG